MRYHTDQRDQKFRGGRRGGEMAIQSPLAGSPVLQTVGIRLGKISPKKAPLKNRSVQKKLFLYIIFPAKKTILLVLVYGTVR